MIALAISIQGVNQSAPFHVNPGNGASSSPTAGIATAGGITTTADNCLIIHVVNESSGAGATPQPGAQTLLADDTGTNGMGAAWTFKKTAGRVPEHDFVMAQASSSVYSATFAIADDGTGDYIPAYHDKATSMGQIVDPVAGTVYPFGGGWQGTTVALTTIGSKAVSYDAIASIADSGINPYHAAASTTPTSSATNLGGTTFNFGSAKDFDPGILFFAWKWATPRDAIDTGTVGGGGVQLAIADSSNNYKSWMIGAFKAKTSDPSAYNIAVIQPTQTQNTGYATSVTPPNYNAITKFQYMTATVGGGGANYASMLALLQKVHIAGGSADVPASFSDVLAAINGFVIPVAKVLGDGAAMAYLPIQVGGADAVHLDLSAFSLQFPRRAANASEYLDFHVDENAVGLIFDARAGDTVKMKNGAVQGASPYLFRFESTVSPSASWDFSGLTVIGATPTLRNIGTSTSAGFVDMTWVNCSPIDQNGATLTRNSFLNTKVMCDSLADMALISGSSFESGGTGHAIEVTGSADTITFNGNTFEGYAGTNGSTGNEAIFVNIASGTVTLNISGGGSTPSIRTAGATVVVNNSVSVTISANVSLSGAEVRIYDMDGAGGTDYGTELSGTESHGAATYVYGGSVGNLILIQVMKPGYVEFTQQYTMPSANATLDITLTPDLNA